MSEIDIGAIYPLYKGAWSSGAAYDFLDMVTKDGSSYLCIAEDGAPVGTALTSTSHWALIAQKGDTGEDGVTPVLTIGTVTTGEAGTNAAVTIEGTSPNYQLNFTIPKGADGEDGTSVVAYKGTRDTTGNWTITGLTVNKPLYVIVKVVASLTGPPAAELRTVSGAEDGITPQDGHRFRLAGASGSQGTSNVFIVIPTETTVVLYSWFNTHAELRAYQ